MSELVRDALFRLLPGTGSRCVKWLVKAHVMCGVKTNIITAVEVTATDTADAPFSVPFVQTAANHFTVNEGWADVAYFSERNLRVVQAVGQTA